MSAGACELRLANDRWVLTGDPYVLHRAEKAIPFSESHKNGSLSFPATEETAVELMWLQQRFPFHCRHEMLLRRDAAKHNLRLIQARGVMNGKYDPSAIRFRDGMAPREYQSQAALLWRSMGGLLCADGLGTGKTIVGLAGIASPEMLPAVIVCPANLCFQWQSQIDKFIGSATSYIISKQKNYPLDIVATCEACGEAATAAMVATRRCKYCKSNRFKRSLADIYIVSYSLAHYWASSLSQIAKSVIFDEAHELRLADSKKYEGCKRIAREATFRLGLSGTPVVNWGGEMFNILNVVCPGKLGDKRHFRETWCGYSDREGKEPPLKNPEAFGEYLKAQNLMIRRTREDVGRSIPTEQRIVHSIDFDDDVFKNMTKNAKELARVMLRLSESSLKSGGEMVAAGQFGSMMYQATGVAKAAHVARFVEILLESGEPVMLFGYHVACFQRGTKAIKLDGTFINVEDVKIGDKLLGPDGAPRLVKSLTRGHGKMYRIIPNKGEPWVCSEHHILSVHDTDKLGRRISEISVADYLKLSDRKKRSLVLFRSKAQKFDESRRVLEPWLLGMWLGDGAASLNEIKISKPDEEIVVEMDRIAKKYGCTLRKNRISESSRLGNPETYMECNFLSISSGLQGPKDRNVLLRHFKSLGLRNNKHIPHEYKTACIEDRWELLAGLIDSDGHVSRREVSAGNMTFTNINKALSEDVAFVARSLGLGVTIKQYQPRGHGRKQVFVVQIFGDLTPLPTRIARKRPLPRKRKTSVLHTGFRVEQVEDDNFFGFEVDKDHLFLLDDFTVVHNCYEIWCRELRKFSPLLFTGNESRAVKERNKQAFMAGESNLLICSIESGVGIDGIQDRCNVGVFGELSWSPAKIQQAIGRYHRDGQTKPCMTYLMTSDAGIDPYMIQTLSEKKLQVDGVIHARDTSHVMDSIESAEHLRRLAQKFLAA